MAFQIGNRTYADADAKVKIIPLEGDNANQAFTIKSKNSCKLAPNAKAVLLQGASGAPVSIVTAEAEPEWEVGLSAMEETMDLIAHLGAGAARIACRVEITWARTGLTAHTFKVPLTYITKGLGFETDSGSAPKDTIGGMAQDILLDEKSILVRDDEAA